MALENSWLLQLVPSEWKFEIELSSHPLLLFVLLHVDRVFCDSSGFNFLKKLIDFDSSFGVPF